MDTKAFIERLHESENLTDNLEDPEARWLLDWGSAQVGRLVGNMSDIEAAGTRVNALMKFMRRLNGAASALPGVTPQDLSELLDQYMQTFGGTRSFNPADHARITAALAGKSTRDALAYLIEWAGSGKTP